MSGSSHLGFPSVDDIAVGYQDSLLSLGVRLVTLSNDSDTRKRVNSMEENDNVEHVFVKRRIRSSLESAAKPAAGRTDAEEARSRIKGPMTVEAFNHYCQTKVIWSTDEVSFTRKGPWVFADEIYRISKNVGLHRENFVSASVVTAPVVKAVKPTRDAPQVDYGGGGSVRSAAGEGASEGQVYSLDDHMNELNRIESKIMARDGLSQVASSGSGPVSVPVVCLLWCIAIGPLAFVPLLIGSFRGSAASDPERQRHYVIAAIVSLFVGSGVYFIFWMLAFGGLTVGAILTS